MATVDQPLGRRIEGCEVEGLTHFQVCRYYEFFCGDPVEAFKLDLANLKSLLRVRDAKRTDKASSNKARQSFRRLIDSMVFTGLILASG